MTRSSAPRSTHRQRGVTLLVMLVFLLIFAGVTAAVYRNSLSSVQAIGNMQWRNESIAAAHEAVDRLLSNPDFATKTAAVVETVTTAPFQYDANGDSVSDILVTFPAVTADGTTSKGPRLLRSEAIAARDLDPFVDADKVCLGGQDQNTGMAEAGTGDTSAPRSCSASLCANAEWSITVRATDAVTNTSVDIVQGVGVRQARKDEAAGC